MNKGLPYFDYQIPGHSARQTDTQVILEVYSGYASFVWIENCYITRHKFR